MALTTRKAKRAAVRRGMRQEGGGPKSAPVLRTCTVSQWGNSLGLRIPQEAADRFHLRPGGQVSLEVGPDSIIIRPVRPRKKWSEADLLAGVTPELVGGEVDWGGPVGKEAG